MAKQRTAPKLKRSESSFDQLKRVSETLVTPEVAGKNSLFDAEEEEERQSGRGGRYDCLFLELNYLKQSDHTREAFCMGG